MLERQQNMAGCRPREAVSAALVGCELFRGLESGGTERMLDCLGGRVVSRGRGAALFAEGSRAGRFGIVLSGSLVVVKDHVDGRRAILKRIGARELVGAAQAFSGAGRMNVRVEADTPSRILLLDAERVGSPCCNACPVHVGLVRNLVRILAAKTLELNAKIGILSRRTTEERLLAWLRSFAEKCGCREFDIPFDRQQLADFLCVERSALSAVIGRLSRKGVLSSRKRHFVLNPERSTP